MIARLTRRVAASLVLAALFFTVDRARADTRNTFIFRGGAIYTLVSAHPWATALVVRGGHIVYVGNDAGTKAFQTPVARIIALKGRMILPGFHDGHAHPMSGAIRLIRCRLDDFSSMPALYAGVTACASATKSPWLVGYGLSSQLLGPGGPDRLKLDALLPDRPAFLTTTEGFTAWVNSAALKEAGIDPEGTAPEINGVERDPVTHKPTGILKDDATNLVRSEVPKPTQAEYREALRRATAMANRFGITSIFDASVSALMLDAYHAADLANELTVRVVAAQLITARGPEQIDDMIAERDRVRGRRFRADAAKFFLDGEIDNHTAAMLEPYADTPDSRGELLIQTDALNALVHRLDAEGFMIHMHVMGDRAVRAGLDAIALAIQADGPRDRRHQLAHIGVADPIDVKRFCTLGVTANFQPLFAAESDPTTAPDRIVLGPQRARWMYPMASIAACGARIVASSDWPQPTMNPLDEIEAALIRSSSDRRNSSQPRSLVDLPLMLAAYTKNAAWAAREEDIDGALEVGKAADLVVLDRNLFRTKVTAIHKAHVLLTLLDGETVYRDPNFRDH